MKLLTKELEKKFEKYPYLSQDGKEKDAEVLVKYFNPVGAGTWLITEAEKQENGDWLLFGYCHILEWEWGSVMLSELESIKGPFGIGIERDLYIGNKKYIKDFPETDYYGKEDKKPNITIGNYSVDNVNWFKEHEGFDAFKCDILYCGQKIGTFSESYMGGPDEYTFINDFDSELRKFRKTADDFNKKYSLDPNFSENEDMLIRLLKSIKEASEKTAEDEMIIINTSYPYDYDIKENDSLISLGIIENDKSKYLAIPLYPMNINIDVEFIKDDDYELV